MSSCRACYAEVLWLANERTGKKNPIDAKPNPQGNIERVGENQYRILTKKQLEMGQGLFGEPVERYMSHFATCTDPQYFRRCQTCHNDPCVCSSKSGSGS